MADPFEQFKESDAAIEQARQTVEAQEAAEAAAAEAARIAAQEEAARRAAEQAEQARRAQEAAAQAEAARQQYNQYGQPQQQYSEAQYGQPQQQYSEAQYGQMQPQTQTQQQYNQYGQPQQQQTQQFTQGASFMSEEDLPPEYRPVSMWGYVGYEVLFSLPVVGLVLMFIFSFSGTDNANLKNFARAKLIMIAIGVALFVVLIVAAGAFDLFEELFG